MKKATKQTIVETNLHVGNQLLLILRTQRRKESVIQMRALIALKSMLVVQITGILELPSQPGFHQNGSDFKISTKRKFVVELAVNFVKFFKFIANRVIVAVALCGDLANWWKVVVFYFYATIEPFITKSHSKRGRTLTNPNS